MNAWSRVFPLLSTGVPRLLAMAVPAFLSACVAAAATERTSAHRGVWTLCLGAVLVPVLGHGLARALATIRAREWGRPWSWAGLGLVSGLILAPGSGIQGGPAEPMWWAKVVILGLLAASVVLLLASIPARQESARTASSRLVVACASAYALVALTWLLAYWPGVMTVDSVVQWHQLTRGSFNNEHPAFHTALLWLFSAGGRSPALAVLAQIVLLTLTLGLCLDAFAEWGVPGWVIAAVTLVFSVMPANLLLAITLWKDIPFTAMVMCLSALMLRLGRTQGEALRRPGFLLALFGTATALALFRHNGLPIVAGLTVVLPLVVPWSLRSRALAAPAMAIVAFVVLSGPVLDLAGVGAARRAFKAAIPIHQVGALASEVPHTFDDDERAFLSALQPFSTWQHRYACHLVNPLLFEGLDVERFETMNPQFLALWLRHAKEHPEVILRHLGCVSSIVWAVRRSGGYLYLGDRAIIPNQLGLRNAPKLGSTRELMNRYLDWSGERARVWWMWGTAFYLYLALAIGVSTALRTRAGWSALFVLPAVLCALSLLVVNVAQDFRYMFPMYVIGLLSLALPFVATRRVSEPERPAPEG